MAYGALVGVVRHFWNEHQKIAAEEAEDLGLKEQL